MSIRAAETDSLLGNDPRPVLRTDIPWEERLARGLVAGHQEFKLHCKTPVAITATAGQWTDLTQHPINLLPTPQLVEVTSSDAADTLAGTGVQRIVIWGLPDNKAQVPSTYEPPWQSEVIDMDGVALARSALTYASIVGSRPFAVGPGGVNAGDIDITGATDTDPLHRMPLGRGEGQPDQLATPFGWHAVINKIWVSWSAVATPLFWELREDTGSGRRRTLWEGESIASNTGSEINIAGAVCVTEGATIYFRARRDTGPAGETALINCTGHMFVIDGASIPGSLPGV
jgi:hypothetical protein